MSRRGYWWAVIVFGLGLVLGVVFQKWITIGKVLDWMRPAPAMEVIARPEGLDDESTFCILVLGQSNAANHGWPRARAGKDCYALSAEGWHPAVDPLPGASGEGGSVWTRLAPLMMRDGRTEKVVFACVAQGSSRVVDWLEGGRHEPRIRQILQVLRREELKVDLVIWHQGETESWDDDSDGELYAEQLKGLFRNLRAQGVMSPIMVCQTSVDPDEVVNAAIRDAQKQVAQSMDGVILGPDTDLLGLDHRKEDRVHWNQQGMEAFSQMLMRSMDGAALFQ